MNRQKRIFLILLGSIAILSAGCGKTQEEVTEEHVGETETMVISETESETITEETDSTESETEIEIESEASESEEITEASSEESSATPTETTTVPEIITTVAPVTETNIPPETTTTAVETESSVPETTTETEISAVSQKFEPGIWWSTGSGGDRYFCFYSGSNSGSFRDQESGIGLAFDYESVEDSDRMIFHIGDIADSTLVTVNFTDSSTAVLTWDNGSTETLKYQGLGNFDTFRFYNNLELCEMAMDYYEANNGYRPADAEADVQADGKIQIQIYDDIDGNRFTSAWYTVDRFTAKGTDMTGGSVSLNGG